MPLVSALNVWAVTLPTVTGEPLDGVMTYPVTALPPLSVGAAQPRVMAALPGVPTTSVGAAGTVGLGVTEPDGAELPPVPTVLIAAMTNA